MTSVTKSKKQAERAPKKQSARRASKRLTIEEAADWVINDRREVLKELEKH